MKTYRGGRKKSIFSRHFLQQSITFFQQLLETKKHKTWSTPYPLKSSIIGWILNQENPGNLTYVVQIPRLHCFIQTFAEFLNFVLHFNDLYIRLQNKKDLPHENNWWAPAKTRDVITQDLNYRVLSILPSQTVRYQWNYQEKMKRYFSGETKFSIESQRSIGVSTEIVIAA